VGKGWRNVRFPRKGGLEKQKERVSGLGGKKHKKVKKWRSYRLNRGKRRPSPSKRRRPPVYKRVMKKKRNMRLTPIFEKKKGPLHLRRRPSVIKEKSKGEGGG